MSLGIQERPAKVRARETHFALGSALLIVVGFLVLYPLLSLFATSFEANELGRATVFGLDNWLRLFTQQRIGRAIWNTVTLSLTRQAISIVIGVTIAWLIARSNLPGRKWMEVGFWIALFMPALPVTLGWVFLIAGRSGVLNKALAGLPFVDGPVFSAYSWWGIVWVHLMTSTIAIKVFLLVPAFRAMDAALEEAARASGASLPRVLRTIVAPIMAPVILVVALIGLVRAMQAFEVELILGTPRNIEVYSTFIFRAMTQEPPQIGLASALSITFFASIVPLVVLQQWYAGGRNHATISSRFQQRAFDLGRGRWPAAALIWALLFLMTATPFVCLLLATFMKLFGVFTMDNPWTTQHWIDALARGDVVRALWNSLRLGLMSALIGMIAFTGLAYMMIKTRMWGRRALDFLTWTPTLIPGLVLSLGLLQMFTGVSLFRPLYGTIAVLVIAVLISTATVGVQLVRGALRNLGNELEEAGWAAGGSRFYTFRRVVLPLIAPTVAVIGLEIFAAANSAVGIVALLGTGATQPLAMLQLVLLDSGKFEMGAVIGVVIMTLTVGSALLARAIAARTGLGRTAV